MIEIPTFIKSKIIDSKNYNIPKIIIQTFKTNHIHEKIYNNIMNILKINPNYNYYLITDDIGRSLIKKYFDSEILNAFNKLNIGAAKGDFLRYIAIYVYGGIYIDLDSTITFHLDNFIDNNLSHYFIFDENSNMMNTPIISKPKNPIILNVIKEVTKRINNYESNIFLATGPTVFTDVIFNDIVNKTIYDTRINVSNDSRAYLWIDNENYKNGKLIYKGARAVCGFHFHMKDCDSSLLYPNSDKYHITFNAPTPYLYKNIHIGSSDKNSKTIKLNKIYPTDTKLVFLHSYQDTFSYVFDSTKLIVTRTDKNEGWGHNLIGYL